MLKTLTSGNEVITTGGLMGTVTSVTEHYAAIEISEGVEIKIQKSSVSAIVPEAPAVAVPSRDSNPLFLAASTIMLALVASAGTGYSLWLFSVFVFAVVLIVVGLLCIRARPSWEEEVNCYTSMNNVTNNYG